MRLPLLPPLLALLVFAAQAPAQSADALIKSGDLHYDRLQAAEALKYYLPAEKLQPENADLLVKISRQYRHLMSDASSRDEKLRLGATATEYAERASRLAPNDSDAQLAVGITLGKILPYQTNNRERLEASRRIKNSAETALRLNPRNDLAWHILGRWHLVMSELSGIRRAVATVVYGSLPKASNAEAARCFQKALALEPDRLMHHVELGRTYAALGQKDEARRHLKQGLAMRETEKDDAETKQKGRELLGTLR